MVNKIVLILITISLIFSSANAKRKTYVTKEKVGQKYYLDKCSSCHGNGNRGGNLYSTYEWIDIFKNDAKELWILHDGEDGVEDIMSYIISDDFKSKAPDLLRFLKEFAYDSDAVPSCN